MRVLVTGATGFIGKELMGRLDSSERFEVVAAVREPATWTGPETVTVVDGELGPSVDWRHSLAGVDAIVHTAARVHVMREAVADPLAAFRKVNVDGTLHLADQAADAGVRRFVFLSSIKVLGERTQSGRPFVPTDSPEPVDDYAQSKYEAEAGLTQIAARTGMELVIVRPPLVYGPGVSANFLTLLRWTYRGIPLPFAGIRNRRSMIGLDNLVDVLVRCLVVPEAAGRIFLVSDGDDLSTTELLVRVGAALGRRSRLFRLPSPFLHGLLALVGKKAQADRLLNSLQVDITETKEILGWSPRVPVDEQLSRVAGYFLGGQE